MKKREILRTVGGNINCAASTELVGMVLKKLIIELPYNSAIPLLGIYPKETNALKKIVCTPISNVSLFTIAKTKKQPRCPLMDTCIKKVCYIYTMEYYSDIKKEILLFVTT